MNMPNYASNVSEEDVEHLISQLQDENLLKMSVDNHSIRSMQSSKKKNILYTFQEADDGGLQSDMAARYAKLKARNSDVIPAVTTRPEKAEYVRNVPSTFQSDHANATTESDDSDALSTELEARLRALKSPVGISFSASDPSTHSTNTREGNMDFTTSNLSYQSRSNPSDENPITGSIVTSYQEENGDDLDSAVADVKKLLRTVRDEIRLEKQLKNKQKWDAQDSLIEEDSDLFDVGLMEEEYVEATMEEDRLTRAAEEVVRWAKDAVRLGDCENEEELESDNEVLDVPSTSPPDPKPEKKKVKGWRLFK